MHSVSGHTHERGVGRITFLIPLLVCVVIGVFLYRGLSLNPREVPSPLIGKAAPEFKLPSLHQPDTILSPASFAGKPWILNVWASWCVACRQEHPVVTNLAQRVDIPVIGLDYKDQPEDGKAWLTQFGDPYDASIVDLEGNAGLDWGVYGVPETFLIDANGVIQFKHIGPLTSDIVETRLMSKLAELGGS